MKFLRSVFPGVLLFSVSSLLGATVTVEMRNNFFSPATVNINAGDTVTWVQRGSNHDTVSSDGLWSSGILAPGRTFSFTFNNAGAFRYFCTPHQNQGMIGTVNVQGAANTPPTVTLTAPANGATFLTTDTITFSANASDNGSVTSVQFFAGSTSLGTDNSAPYSVTATLPAGNHSITARATDNQGATTTSGAVSITVNAPNQPPTVTLTAPSAGATFSTGDTITFSANASDDGSVASVEFFAGSTSLGTDSAAPYSITGTLPAGTHSITARATDNTGASTTSSAVSITVQGAQNQSPTVTLTSPAPGLLSAPGNVILRADAADPDGSIARVEFFNGSTSLGSDTAAPFELSLSDLAAGVYSFTATATDNAGASSTSAAVAVRIAAQPRITSVTRSGSTTTINLDATSDIPVTLEATSDFASWTAVGTNTPSNGNTVFTDSSNEQKRFYRAVVR